MNGSCHTYPWTESCLGMVESGFLEEHSGSPPRKEHLKADHFTAPANWTLMDYNAPGGTLCQDAKQHGCNKSTCPQADDFDHRHIELLLIKSNLSWLTSEGTRTPNSPRRPDHARGGLRFLWTE